MLSRRPALSFLSLLLLVVAIAGCGQGPGNRPTASAPNEGPYVTTGGLRYQVQMSRVLNPFDAEDKDYLIGINHPIEAVGHGKTVWFGVFIRVEHHFNNGPQVAAFYQHFLLTDTEGHHLAPTPLPPTNVYGYRSTILSSSNNVLPNPDSTAAAGPIGGALLLFRVNQLWLENRPVKLIISPPNGGHTANVTLDI